MILIQCALYVEAKPLIEKFDLKKNMKENFFEVFENDDIKLIISGYGKINASSSATYLVSKNLDCNAFLNIGIAGSRKRKIGEAVLINKLKDYDTQRTFYPDILLKHKFKEGFLETFSKVVNFEVEDLCDMEGSAFFEALSRFLPPHKIQLIKIVSDKLDGERLDFDFVYDIVKQNVEYVEDYINCLNKAFKKDEFFDVNDKIVINTIVDNLSLTEFQKNEFIKNYISFKLRKEDLNKIDRFLKLKVKNKNEGKKYYNELIRIISE
ncbi:Nucleoside phosphorylase [Caloramator fervidus]|uniref:Nucleoside phosphorylase n=1 Tax=Caloramator fervidus TaxID=29344 RepID=A0A1H5UU11_9CLOT|nr:hypothetical protein [Caloramator fervidus]SEF78553.1 Nucleoside phosphorylase [Caloramator fervidus]